MHLEKKLKNIFKNIFKTKINIENLSTKKSAKWDSLKHLDLIFSLEEQFKLKFSNKEITTIKSFAICLKILKKKLKL